jgi:cytochrome P450
LKLHAEEFARARAWSKATPFEGLTESQMSQVMNRGRALHASFRSHVALHNSLNAAVIVFLFCADYFVLMRLPAVFLQTGTNNPVRSVLLAACLSGALHSYLSYSLSVFSMHEGAAHRIIFVGGGRLGGLAQTLAGNLCRFAASDPQCYAPQHMAHHARFGTEVDAEFLNFVGVKRYLATFLPLAAFINFSDFVAHRPLTYTPSRVASGLLSIMYNGVYAYLLFRNWGLLFVAVAMLIVFPHFGFYLDRLRHFTEHNLMPLANQNGSRSFGVGFWGLLVGGGPWGSPCHWEHHLVPSLPWYQQLVLHRHLIGLLTTRQREQFLIRPVVGFPLLWWKLVRNVSDFEEFNSTSEPKAVPGTPPKPHESRWAQIAHVLRDPLDYLTESATYGPIVALRPGHTYLLTEPEYIKQVLQDNHANYSKGPRYRRALKPLFGNGLLTSEGETWLRQRRMIQPAFLKRHHEMFAANIVNGIRAIKERWKAAGTAPLNLHEEMMRLTLSILLRTMFSRESAAEADEMGRAFLQAEGEMNVVHVFNPFHLPSFVPTPSRLRFDRANRSINRFIARIATERRRTGPTEEDLSALLAFACDEAGQEMSDVQLRDEITSIIGAGHDTTLQALTWAFYLLGHHPSVMGRLTAEAIGVMGQGTPSADTPAKLPFTTMVVHETMRLYPPIWGVMRTATNADVIGGYAIPAGAGIIISPYVMHRLPALWAEPHRFWPERFSSENSAGRHRFAYFPFSAGPRQCAGGSFAILEMTLVLAMLSAAFEFELSDIREVRPKARITLKPGREIFFTVRERKLPRTGVQHAG